MKIIYFMAKNFSTIYSGMKRKVVEIDLRKSKNRIVLFIGDNGTGKTALLSNFHPFAYPGSMDVRSGPELILENEDGYKEVHILHEDDTYVVKHHYMFKSGKGMKSFIAKNGEELNPNGNVTSFKEVVLTHLGIEQEYLALLRLGSNVTGFIDKKAGERKDFTSDLLKDIDIYTQFYKKVNDDVRALKAVMKTVSDKIDKLKIYDEKEEISRLKDLEENLQLVRSDRDILNGKIGQINGAIAVLAPDGVDRFNSLYAGVSRELSWKISELEKKQSKLGKYNFVVIGSDDDWLKEAENALRDCESKLTLNSNMIEFYFNQLNGLHTQREEKGNNLKYISSELEYSKIVELLLELNREKERLDVKFKKFVPKCTRADMLNILLLLQEIDKLIASVQEFDETAVRNVVGMMLKGNDVDYMVQREVTKIDDRMVKINSQLQRMDESLGINPNAVYVLYKPEGSDCVCPYLKFYEDVKGAQKGTERGDLQSELKALENKREIFLAYPPIVKKIEHIYLLIKSNAALIEKSPENFFEVKKILNAIKDFIPFYEEDHVTNYIAVLEEYEEYLALQTKIEEVQKEKTFIEKNSTTLMSLQKELETLDLEIDKIQRELVRLREENEGLSCVKETLLEKIDTFKEFRAIKESLSEEVVEIEQLQTQKKEMQDTWTRIEELEKSKHVNLIELTRADNTIKALEETISTTRFRLMEFASLNKEKEMLEEKYDDIAIIKEALSSNKGIPLLFMQLYLKNTKITVNNLLHTVYKGNLEVEDFIINDKEFRIPYTKNGITVSDVIHCSQGEMSFVSIALSFALIEQSLQGYNIMLLDEIDATLDAKNRYLFISILEKQLESIGAEQVFMITHNNMFDNYPVDVIITSDVKIDNNKNINVIFSAVA